MESMEIVWRQRESDTFHGNFMVKLVWRLSGVFMEKTRLIKLPDNRHTDFTAKSPIISITPHTVLILST